MLGARNFSRAGTKKAKQVAKKLFESLRKTCAEVVKKKGAATGSAAPLSGVIRKRCALHETARCPRWTSLLRCTCREFVGASCPPPFPPPPTSTHLYDRYGSGGERRRDRQYRRSLRLNSLERDARRHETHLPQRPHSHLELHSHCSHSERLHHCGIEKVLPPQPTSLLHLLLLLLRYFQQQQQQCRCC